MTPDHRRRLRREAVLMVALLIVATGAALMERERLASREHAALVRADSLAALLDTTRRDLDTFRRLAVPTRPAPDRSDRADKRRPEARVVATFRRGDTTVVDTVEVVRADSAVRVVPFRTVAPPVVVDGAVRIHGDSAHVVTTVGILPVTAKVRVGCRNSAPEVAVTAAPFDSITIDSAQVAPDVCRKPAKRSWVWRALEIAGAALAGAIIL